MDPQTDLPDLVEDLEVNIDELSDALQPLLEIPLHDTASSLPLLDKAKLYVLAAYSVESLLFSALQASGVNAKEHAIFAELARLRGYYGKIKEAEERDLKPKTRVDVGAAQRFIKHGLSGNDKYDLERAERMAKEKARAALKARQINKKFNEQGEEMVESATPKKRSIEETSPEESDEDEEDTEASSALSQKQGTPAKNSIKHQKRDKRKNDVEAEEQITSSDPAPKKEKDRKRKKKNRTSKGPKQPSE